MCFCFDQDICQVHRTFTIYPFVLLFVPFKLIRLNIFCSLDRLCSSMQSRLYELNFVSYGNTEYWARIPQLVISWAHCCSAVSLQAPKAEHPHPLTHRHKHNKYTRTNKYTNTHTRLLHTHKYVHTEYSSSNRQSEQGGYFFCVRSRIYYSGGSVIGCTGTPPNAILSDNCWKTQHTATGRHRNFHPGWSRLCNTVADRNWTLPLEITALLTATKKDIVLGSRVADSFGRAWDKVI